MSKQLIKVLEEPSSVSLNKIKSIERKQSSSVSKISFKDNEKIGDNQENDSEKNKKAISETSVKKLGKKNKVKDERRGHVIFKHVYFNIADHPRSLCDVSLEILPGQRVGIIGEKFYDSNIIAVALYRGKDYYTGHITIDGKSLSSIDAVRKVFIVHSNPIFHSDTIRDNLDPFGELADKKIWDVLERVGLRTKLTKNGTNLDVIADFKKLEPVEGQLFSLAVALLKNPSIIIVKEREVTDKEDDVTKLHNILNKEFKHTSVMFLTGHLTTINICDKICYFKEGKIIEEGSPKKLLNNTRSKLSQYILNQSKVFEKRTKLLNLVIHSSPTPTKKKRTHLSLTKLLNNNNIDALKNLDLNMFIEDEDELNGDNDISKEPTFIRSAFNIFVNRKSEHDGVKISDVPENKKDCQSINVGNEGVDKSAKRDLTVTVEDCFDAIFQEELEEITVEECDYGNNFDTESKLKELEQEIDKEIDEAKQVLSDIHFSRFGDVTMNVDDIDKPIPAVVYSKKDFSYGVFPQDIVYNTEVDKTPSLDSNSNNVKLPDSVPNEKSNVEKEIITIKPVARKPIEETILKSHLSTATNLDDSVEKNDYTSKNSHKVETIFKALMKPQKFGHLQKFIDENKILYEIEEDAFNKMNRVFEINDMVSATVVNENKMKEYGDVEKSVTNIVKKRSDKTKGLIRSEETGQNDTNKMNKWSSKGKQNADVEKKNNPLNVKESDSATVNISKSSNVLSDKPSKMSKTKKIDMPSKLGSNFVQNFTKNILPVDKTKDTDGTKNHLKMKVDSDTNQVGKDKMKAFDIKDEFPYEGIKKENSDKIQYIPNENLTNHLKHMRTAGTNIKNKGIAITKQISALGDIRR